MVEADPEERAARESAHIRALVRAQILVHAGGIDALAAALHTRRPDEGRTFDHERRMVLALALVQAGRVDEAIAELEGLPESLAGKGPATAHRAGLALAYAAAGRAADARELADAGDGQGTYLDQLQCLLAGAFASLQTGDPDAAQRFDAALAFADASDARLDQVVVRVAHAHAWTALGRADASDAARRRRHAPLGTRALDARLGRAFRLAARATTT